MAIATKLLTAALALFAKVVAWFHQPPDDPSDDTADRLEKRGGVW